MVKLNSIINRVDYIHYLTSIRKANQEYKIQFDNNLHTCKSLNNKTFNYFLTNLLMIGQIIKSPYKELLQFYASNSYCNTFANLKFEMDVCVENLGLEIAKRKHYNQILDITKGENLYNGMDYLPFALKNWLDEAENEKSNRLNVIYTLDAKVVGFRSV